MRPADLLARPRSCLHAGHRPALLRHPARDLTPGPRRLITFGEWGAMARLTADGSGLECSSRCPTRPAVGVLQTQNVIPSSHSFPRIQFIPLPLHPCSLALCMLGYSSAHCSPVMQSICPFSLPAANDQTATPHIVRIYLALCSPDPPSRYTSAHEQRRLLNCWLAVRSMILLRSRKPRFHSA